MLLRMRRRATPMTKSEATRHMAEKIATALERVAAVLEKMDAEPSSTDQAQNADDAAQEENAVDAATTDQAQHAVLAVKDVANLTEAFKHGIRTLRTLSIYILTTAEPFSSSSSHNS